MLKSLHGITIFIAILTLGSGFALADEKDLDHSLINSAISWSACSFISVCDDENEQASRTASRSQAQSENALAEPVMENPLAPSNQIIDNAEEPVMVSPFDASGIKDENPFDNEKIDEELSNADFSALANMAGSVGQGSGVSGGRLRVATPSIEANFEDRQTNIPGRSTSASSFEVSPNDNYQSHQYRHRRNLQIPKKKEEGAAGIGSGSSPQRAGGAPRGGGQASASGASPKAAKGRRRGAPRQDPKSRRSYMATGPLSQPGGQPVATDDPATDKSKKAMNPFKKASTGIGAFDRGGAQVELNKALQKGMNEYSAGGQQKNEVIYLFRQATDGYEFVEGQRYVVDPYGSF